MDIRTVPMEKRHVQPAAAAEALCFSSPWSEKSLSKMLCDPHSHFICAEDADGAFLGYAGFCEVCGEASMYDLAVLPEHRRLGVGSALMEAVFAECAALGAERITLEVRRSNAAAVALYEKLGFTVAGTRRGFYKNPAEDGLTMEKDV